MKKCSKCGEIKSVKEFYVSKSASDGLCSSCKECNKEYQKERHKEYWSRPEVKGHRKEYLSRPEVKEYHKEYQKEYHKEYWSRPEVKGHRKKSKHLPVVYLMSDQGERVKIGITTNLKQRICYISNEIKLYTNNPAICLYQVECESVEEATKLEAELHKMFEEYKVVREWYTFNEEIVNWFKKAKVYQETNR